MRMPSRSAGVLSPFRGWGRWWWGSRGTRDVPTRRTIRRPASEPARTRALEVVTAPLGGVAARNQSFMPSRRRRPPRAAAAAAPRDRRRNRAPATTAVTASPCRSPSSAAPHCAGKRMVLSGRRRSTPSASTHREPSSPRRQRTAESGVSDAMASTGANGCTATGRVNSANRDPIASATAGASTSASPSAARITGSALRTCAATSSASVRSRPSGSDSRSSAFGREPGQDPVDDVVAGERRDADGEVDRGAALGDRRMQPPARQIERVTGFEHGVDHRVLPGAGQHCRAVVGPGLVGQRVGVDGFVHPPVFASATCRTNTSCTS